MKKSFIFIAIIFSVVFCIYLKLSKQVNNNKIDTTSQAISICNEAVNNYTYDFSSSCGSIPENLKKSADEISEKYDSVGIQLAVMKNSQLIFTYEYGYADLKNKVPITSETKIRVASLSKLVTDCVFMKLCDLGTVSIDEDISKYLGFDVRNPYFPDKIITASMLMAHTSSIVDSSSFDRSRENESCLTIEELLSYRNSFCQAEPGTYYAYSNFGNAIIGAICEKVTSTPFNELAKKYFFDPLEIDASYVASELQKPELLANLYGSGGLTVEAQMSAKFNPNLGQTHHIVQGNLIASAKDYLKILSMITKSGISETGERILSENTLREMFKSRIYAEGLGSGFGIEENKNIFSGKTVYTHTGNSYGMHSIYIIDPETGNGMVVLTSGSNVKYVDSLGIYDICYDYVKLMFPQ